VDYIQKEKKPGMRYSIVSHDAVTAKIRPILHKHGIVYHVAKLNFGQEGNRTWAYIEVDFVNVDDPSERITAHSFGYGVDDQDKGPGKAMSYAVKYALLKTLGLETGDDPDEVQGHEADYVPVPKPAKGISPHDFQNEPGENSTAQGARDLAILQPLMLAQNTAGALSKWWREHKEEISQLNTDMRWSFFERMINRGLDICKKAVEVELFWSQHESALRSLRKANVVKFEGLEEYMIKRAKDLAPLPADATLEFINAG
jgi:hypothetical protein